MIKPDETLWEQKGNETADGSLLSFRIPKALTFRFYRGFSGKDAFSLPDYTETDEYRIYTFRDLPAGSYSYETEGEGFYKIHRNFSYTERKKNFLLTVTAKALRMAGTGYEPNGFIFYTAEELDRTLPSSAADFPGYESALKTPAFTRKARKTGIFRSTDSEEEQKFLEKTLKNVPYVRHFTVGYSDKYKLPLELYVFSGEIQRDTEVKSVAEAARICKRSGRPTVLYGAQIHGCEPAGKEGALAVMKALAGSCGRELLERENVVILPCQNPDAARDFIRKSPFTDKDMNRDHLRTESGEIRLVHQVFQTFLPEVFIDGHEYYAPAILTGDGYPRISDALIGTGGMVNNGAALRDLSEAIIKTAANELDRNGIQTNFYPRLGTSYLTLNSQNPTTGRSYFSMNGTAVFLVESRGISMGLHLYERRVMTHFIAVTTILNEVGNRSAELRNAVIEERKKLSETGKVFTPENRFVLSTDKAPNPFRQVCKLTSLKTGELFENRAYFSFNTTVPLLSVARPTAYVLPADLPHVKEIRRILKAQGIRFEKVPGPCPLRCKRYQEADKKGRNTEEIFCAPGVKAPFGLTKARNYTFEKGVLLLKTAQLNTNVLSYLCEPACPDAGGSAANFRDMKLLELTDLYRMET